MPSDSASVLDRNCHRAAWLEPDPTPYADDDARPKSPPILHISVVAAEALPLTDERYVSARELAVRMGVSVRTVNRLTAAGMPSETWGMARTRRYLPSQAIAWAHARHVVVDSWEDDKARSAADSR